MFSQPGSDEAAGMAWGLSLVWTSRVVIWALVGAIALLDLGSPAQVVFGYLYVAPILLVSSQRGRRLAINLACLCCGLTLLNLVVPQPSTQWPADLLDRLLVCLALSVSTGLSLHIRHLQERRLTLEVRLAQIELRRDFLATLAHDLKTPVLGTIATTRTLLARPDAADPARLRRGLTAILRSQERSLRLIEDLLLSFRADLEGFCIVPTRCDAGHLVHAAIEAVRPIAAERQIQILPEVLAPADGTSLRGDRQALQRMLENLLLNGAAHSLRGGRLRISVWSEADRVKFAVRDEGRGFPVASMERLFDRFYQAEEEPEGSGLGLYLSRQIVDAHRGTIRAFNPPEGGACVEVSLPAGP